MAYPEHIRTFAQHLMLNGMTQVDAIKTVRDEHGIDIPTSTMNNWYRMVILSEEEQEKAHQLRQDAADRAAIRAGTASFLLQNKLDKAVSDEDRFLHAIDQIVELADHGLIDPDKAAQAVDNIRDYVAFTARDLSTIIKDASSQQMQVSFDTGAPTAVQICFGDQLNDGA